MPGVCCRIRGTLIVAAWAGLTERLRGRVVTMVMGVIYARGCGDGNRWRAT